MEDGGLLASTLPLLTELRLSRMQLGLGLVAEIVEKRKVGGAALDDHEAFSDDLKRFRNCNGAFSAHVWGSPMFEKISKNWLACSLVKDCTCPPGSTRANHRQDQAALTVLAHQAGVACRRMHLSVHYHHDDPSDEGTLDGRPKSSRPKSSRRPAAGG